MDLGLADKVFLVTAASSGLGLASARQLVAEGARVVLVARREEALAEVATELNGDAPEDAPRVVPMAGDLLEADTVTEAITRALEVFGQVDGALVSVGGPPAGHVLENTDEQWTTAFSSVFLPALRVARAVYAQNPRARLALVLSTSTRVPLPGMAISNGLRPGLGMLVKQLADEVGPDGGRVVGLMPGSIATGRMTYLFEQASDPKAARELVESQVPLRRMGEPDEFGRVATFLLSDAAGYMSGCVVPVDGGAMRTV
ncbi:SDR family oxidoreductase [Luteococcus peritonei]|uniref:SDR family oxidoreductase n=1 Tax=Luteococcus peritonei TaxID=88874 RepID=A0ABW4RUA8_9ACTN